MITGGCRQREVDPGVETEQRWRDFQAQGTTHKTRKRDKAARDTERELRQVQDW